MKIVVRQPNADPLEFTVTEGDEVKVGRQPDVNTIVITDIKLSRRHGTVRMQDGTFTYTDENSGNGSFIEESRLPGGEAIPLPVGIPVHLGDAVLIIEEGDPQVSATPDASAAAAEAVRAVPEGSTGVLHGIEGPLAGSAFGLGERALFIGRVPACHIHCAEDKLLSRRNTEINRVGDHYEFKDLGSANGTFVDGKKAETGVLRQGDVLTVGESRFRFDFAPLDDAPPVPSPATVESAPSAPESAPAASPAPAPSGKGGAAMVGIAVVVLMLLGTGYYFFFHGPTPPEGGSGEEPVSTPTDPPSPPTKAFPVRVGAPFVMDLAVTLEKTADIHAARRDVIPFTVGMKVEAVHTANQQRVKAGDKLITFELTEALKAARTQAISSVESAKAEIDKAKAEVEKARLALENDKKQLAIAQEAYDTNERLFNAGNLVRSEWDKIRTNRNEAATQVKVREQELTQTQRGVEQAREKQRQAVAQLDDVQAKVTDLTLTAKTAGTVDGLELKKGFTVTRETQSMAIIDYEKEVKVVAAIPEDDIASIRQGMSADVWIARAPNQTARGTVTEIPPTARQRNYDVELTVPNDGGHFRPGAQAKVRFIAETRKDALALPTAVVTPASNGGYTVFVVDTDRSVAVEVPVRRGVEGMREGQKVVEILPDPESTRRITRESVVVIDGHRSLRDGATVEITNREAKLAD